MYDTILILGMFVCLTYRIRLFGNNIDKTLNIVYKPDKNHLKRLDTILNKHFDRMDNILNRLK
jgi:hypothetical protein